MLNFPKNFLWGAATSAYQVEGGNDRSDWWPWEEAAGKERSGGACRHYERFAEDFDLAQALGHNAHRVSIEWARVEPAEGEFSAPEIQHYVDVISALRRRRIEPVVTLHHFTNPLWFSQSGGWEDKRAVKRFVRYVETVTRALAPYVHYWITINEPTILISHAYLFGAWPPQARSILRARPVRQHLSDGHIAAYRKIHDIYRAANLAAPEVSISHHMPAIVACTPTLLNNWAVRLREHWYSFEFLDRLVRHRTLDFIGLNYYSRQLVEVSRWGVGDLLGQVCSHGHHPLKKNSLGWDIYPEGLYQVLRQLKRYDLPVMITENGICTSDDDQRWAFIADHLRSIHRALEAGVPVTGYLYWSLLDNFEWDKGFGPRFGLIHVDYGTFQRTVRDSARKFAQVCRTGVVE
jgi:beta-glucosidase